MIFKRMRILLFVFSFKAPTLVSKEVMQHMDDMYKNMHKLIYDAVQREIENLKKDCKYSPGMYVTHGLGINFLLSSESW